MKQSRDASAAPTDSFPPFLVWAVARLGLRLCGFENFHNTLRKRLHRRRFALGLGELDAYRVYIEANPNEDAELAAIFRIPISRFYRDAAVYDVLAPEIAAATRIWSAGCASGEEPYTIAILGGADVLATDADEGMLERALWARYEEGSLEELPARYRDAFRADGALFWLREELRSRVTFHRQDLRRAMPDGPFDLIFCRNMLLTYVAEEHQGPLIEALATRLVPGGTLVVGSKETMPPNSLQKRVEAPGLYRQRL